MVNFRSFQHTKKSRYLAIKRKRFEKWRPLTELDDEDCLEQHSSYIEKLPYPSQLWDVTPSSPFGAWYSSAYKLISWRPLTQADEKYCMVRIHGWIYQSFCQYDEYWGFSGPPWDPETRIRKQQSLIWVLKHCYPDLSREEWKVYFEEAKYVSHGDDFNITKEPCKSCIHLGSNGHWRGPEWDIYYQYHDGLCRHIDGTLKLL